MKTAVEQLATDGQLDLAGLQRFLGRGDRLKAKLILHLKEIVFELAAQVTEYVKCISGGKKLTLDATNGSELLANAASVFTGWLDSDFVNYETNVSGPPAPATDIEVHEMTKNGDFKAIFGGFDADLDSLCLSQGQIKQFPQKYPEWLHPEGDATFLLFKVGKEFFVADVYRLDGELKADVYRFSHDLVWNAGYRFRVVVPATAKLKS